MQASDSREKENPMSGREGGREGGREREREGEGEGEGEGEVGLTQSRACAHPMWDLNS